MIVYHTADTVLDSNMFVNKVFIVIFTCSSYTLLAISYIINYLLYYFINKTFRNLVNQKFVKLFCRGKSLKSKENGVITGLNFTNNSTQVVTN